MNATTKVKNAIEIGRNADITEVGLFVDDYGIVSGDERPDSLPMKVELRFSLRFLVSVRVEYAHEAFFFKGGKDAEIDGILVSGSNMEAITEITKILIGMAFAKIADGDSLEWRY